MTVSIHAPAWGATGHADVLGEPDVSIHAPAWGATEFQSTRPHGARRNVFQSTRPHGARRTADDCASFQSTRPHGARPANVQSTRPHATVRFNPRARMGRDMRHTHAVRRTRVSIHAPAWGATVSLKMSQIITFPHKIWNSSLISKLSKNILPLRNEKKVSTLCLLRSAL